MTARVYLVRHGETDWSVDRRHTGRTDVPLNAEGRARAAALAPFLAAVDGVATAAVLTSPLGRARDTCRLAGLGDRAVVDGDLAEWDYGEYEGLRTSDLRRDDPGWSIWTAPIERGETLAQVGVRADRVVGRIDELHARSRTVFVFAHAHFLRILGARWCGFDARGGEHLTLLPAGVCVLGYERETRVIEHWNAAGFPRDPE